MGNRRWIGAVVVSLLLLAGVAPAASAAKPRRLVRELVFLRHGAPVGATARLAARLTGGTVLHQYRYAATGFEIETSHSGASRLGQIHAVAQVVRDVGRVIDDAVSITSAHPYVSLGSQVIPNALARVGGAASLAKVRAAGGVVDADIAILDSGIDSEHPDLNVAGGVNCTRAVRPSLEGYPAWHDTMGHGTFVSGMAAAKDNEFGVVGVAPGARLWAVKVFDGTTDDVPGSNYTSVPDVVGQPGVFSGDLLCGWEWVLAHASTLDAVNISLGGGGDITPCDGKVDNAHPTGTQLDERRLRPLTSGTLPQVLLGTDDALHEAVCKVVAAGVTVATAAGNEASDAGPLIPPGYPEVLTVSGLADFDGRPGGLAGRQQECAFNFGDHVPPTPPTGLETQPVQDDTPADFTNYGTVVDVMAPAACDLSTSPGGLYARGDGTSYGSPMVAGAAALYRWHHPSATPAQIAALLKATGTRDYDDRNDPDHIQEPLLNVASLP